MKVIISTKRDLLKMDLILKDNLDFILHDIKENEPGVVLLAEFDDGSRYFSSRGLADVERSRYCDENTIFNLASLSKQFTAFCIHLLEREGKVSLSKSVKEYIPELPSYAEDIKIKNLIHHTSGFKDYIDIAEEKGISFFGDLTPEESLEDVCNCIKPDFEAGKKFAYSNTSYFLLSIVIERVTGVKISKYANDMIFSPLGMKDTFFNESYPIKLETAKGYCFSESGDNYEHKESLWTQTGDGAVYSTANDLIKWGRNFSEAKAGGSELINIISVPNKEELTEILKVEDYQPYASGLVVQHDFGEESLMHSGSWIGYVSFFVRHMDSKLTVVVLSNRDDFNAGEVAYKASEILLNINLNDYDSQSDFGY